MIILMFWFERSSEKGFAEWLTIKINKNGYTRAMLSGFFIYLHYLTKNTIYHF